MTDPAGSKGEEPILTVMWRGNRVQVFGDGPLGRGVGRNANQRSDVLGGIAIAINGAGSLDEMASALRLAVGDTHDVEARVEAGALQIRLRHRAAT